MLVLPHSVRLDLEVWIASGYPNETCGLLIGRPNGLRVEVSRAARATNLARDRASERYELDPADHVAADAAARADGLDVVGVWHSHPDHAAEPSELDRSNACEGWSYLIGRVTARGVEHLRSWRLLEDRFVEEPISTS